MMGEFSVASLNKGKQKEEEKRVHVTQKNWQTWSVAYYHTGDPMTICPWVRYSKSHTERGVSVAEPQDLISYVRKASGVNFYPSSRFLITLFLNNSQSGKTLGFKNSIFLFPVCLVPLLVTCDKEGKSKGSLEWVGMGRMLVTQSLCISQVIVI